MRFIEAYRQSIINASQQHMYAYIGSIYIPETHKQLLLPVALELQVFELT